MATALPDDDAAGTFRTHVRNVYERADSPSYRTVAQATGVARGTIGNLLTGTGIPRWETVKKFVRVYDKRGDEQAQPDMRAWRIRYDEAFGEAAPAEATVETAPDLPHLMMRLAARIHSLEAAASPYMADLMQHRLAEFDKEVSGWAEGEIELRWPDSKVCLLNHYELASDIKAVTTPGYLSVWDTPVGRQLEQACARKPGLCTRIFRFATVSDALAKNDVLRRQHELGITVAVAVDEDGFHSGPLIPTLHGQPDDYAIIDGHSTLECVYDAAGDITGDRWHIHNRKLAHQYLRHLTQLSEQSLPYPQFAARYGETTR